jgi:outer membrane protein assembly factor BamB
MSFCRLNLKAFRGVRTPYALAGMAASLVLTSAHGENWAQWRGPFFNGSTTETNLPTNWSKMQGVLWKTPLPGKSGATPIVWESHVFVVSPDEAKDLRLFCLDKATGAVRWQKVVASGDREQGKNNMASCSPVTEGTRVWAMFGTGDMGCFDFEGNEIWRRSLRKDYGTLAVLFLYGASPLLRDGRLYVPLLQRNPPVYGHAKDDRPERKSVLLCLDAKTGDTVWEHERKTDAREEAMEAYTTPFPYFGPGGPALVYTGADALTAHDFGTGRELWRFSGLNVKKNPGGRIVPSPVAVPGFVYACGPKREMLVALRADSKGLPDAERVAWRTNQFVPDVCTPLVYQEKLFVLDGDRQMMTCFEPPSGTVLWQARMGVREIFYASPTGADGKVYCLSEEGTAVVLSAGNKFDVLATIPMGEGPCRSSIVAAGGTLLIRTARNLYCIGSPQK